MPRKDRHPKTPEICPVCGEDVPPKALACPDCGADHRSGWREDANVDDGIDLPDEEFNYDEFIKGEFGGRAKPAGIRPLWWITGIIVFVVLIALALGLMR